MKIVSTTLTGNSQETIGAALASVAPYVDACIVIDTGITDDTLIKASAAAGEKLFVHAWPWCNDFAAARNEAARVAAEVAAKAWPDEECWQIFIDSDETLTGLETLRPQLEDADFDTGMVTHASGTYTRERIFRLPGCGHWEGPTHEAYMDGGRKAFIEHIRTHEPEKTEEQYRAKFRRDIEYLEKYAPTQKAARWWYYLGDSYRFLAAYSEEDARPPLLLKAVDAYRKCASYFGWTEEGAMACFNAGACCIELGKFYDTVNWCGRGLAMHAGCAELCWLAGVACQRMGNESQAIAWANMAIANGAFGGEHHRWPRIAFKCLEGLYEGPFAIRKECLPLLSPEQIREEMAYQEALRAKASL